MAANLIVIALLSLLLVNLVTIPLASPENKIHTIDRSPEFSWGGMQGEYVFFLDDSPKFSSPLKENVTGNSYSLPGKLEFGTYYWKVESGPFSSGTGRVTIDSSVVVARSGKFVRNEGNTNLMFHSITGFFVLGVNQTEEIDEGENVKAEQF